MGCKSSTEVSSAVACCPMDDTSTSLTSTVNEVEVDLSHFSKSKELLGLGGFGMVRRMTKISGHDNGTEYAIKSMSKAMILSRNSGPTAVMTELRTLIILDDCDYICRIHYAFQDKEHLYMVLDYAAAGDLRYNLRKSTLMRFSENLARMVVHQIFLALNHCHSHNILHRDIKPENVLLKSNGQVILSDFGVAKILPNIERCQATSGTHGYMAPEIYVGDHTHGTTFDWFCTGITLHELLTGRRPFEAVRLQRYFQSPSTSTGGSLFVSAGSIGTAKEKLTLDVIHQYKLSFHCIEFMKTILEPNPKKRLGCREGFQDILQHPWMQKSEFIPCNYGNNLCSASSDSSSASSASSSSFSSPVRQPSVSTTMKSDCVHDELIFSPNTRLIATLIHELPHFEAMHLQYLQSQDVQHNKPSAVASSSTSNTVVVPAPSRSESLGNTNHTVHYHNGNQISKLHVSREEAVAMIQQHQQNHIITEEVQKVFKHFEYNTRHPMVRHSPYATSNIIKRSSLSMISNSSQGTTAGMTTLASNSASASSYPVHGFPSLPVEASQEEDAVTFSPAKPSKTIPYVQDPYVHSHESRPDNDLSASGAAVTWKQQKDDVGNKDENDMESDMDSTLPSSTRLHEYKKMAIREKLHTLSASQLELPEIETSSASASTVHPSTKAIFSRGSDQGNNNSQGHRVSSHSTLTDASKAAAVVSFAIPNQFSHGTTPPQVDSHPRRRQVQPQQPMQPSFPPAPEEKTNNSWLPNLFWRPSIMSTTARSHPPNNSATLPPISSSESM